MQNSVAIMGHFSLEKFLRNKLYSGDKWGSPWGHVVSENPVEVVYGDNVLGGLLVVGNTGVLKTVTPQDFVW